MFNQKTQSALARGSLATGALVMAFSAVVFAEPPHKPDLFQTGSLWEMRAYDDHHPAHEPLVRQRICFQKAADSGTHQRYCWYSTTKFGWKGWAHQEGDQVFMHGDYPVLDSSSIGDNVYSYTAHTALQWEIVTNTNTATVRSTKGFGHCVDWHKKPSKPNIGPTNVFANVKFIRVGKCELPISCEKIDDQIEEIEIDSNTKTACGKVNYVEVQPSDE
jgi:hypothetical protein